MLTPEYPSGLAFQVFTRGLIHFHLLVLGLVQAWWAFETLMNDFGSIILEERKESLDAATTAILTETRAVSDKKGSVQTERYYQGSATIFL